MGETDGGVLLNVQVNPEDAAKEFDKLGKKAVTLEEKLAQGKQALAQATAEAASLGAQLDAAKARQAEMEASGTATADQLKFQAETVASLQSQYNAADRRVEQMSASVEKVNTELTATREKAARVAKELGKGSPALDLMGGHIVKVEKRLMKLASRVMIFSVFTRALRDLRSWFADVIKTDKDAVAAIGQLKGAFLTLVQPLVGVVIPAFTAFLQVLAQVVGAMAAVVASIFGTTVEESAAAAENLNDEKKALDGVGASAKKAGKSLASFDEINKLGGESPAGGAGASSSKEIAPDFSFLDGASERLQEIAKWVMIIGAGFALWKIGSTLGGELGGLLQNLGLIVVAVGGIALLWSGLKDAWENGLDWTNAAAMVGGLAAAFFGLKGLFGDTVGGIALVVGGLALLVSGFHDAFENGWTLQNLLISMAGLFAAGLGISFMTGNWIPALIGGIAALLLAMTVATGHGGELLEGLRLIAQGFLDFFLGIFTGDMERAVSGINTIFEGLGMAVHAVIYGVRDTIFSFLEWLDEKTGGRFHDIIEGAKEIVGGIFVQIGAVVDGIMLALKGLLEFITGVFTGDWDLAWEGVKDIFKGFVNGILGFLTGGVNLMIKAINFVIEKLNGLSFDVPDWVPGIGGDTWGISIPKIQEYQIPKLASGAVIPPNREFAAILGDQTHGNNLEAPEDLIRQIVREEGGGNDAVILAILQQILAAVKEGRVMMVDDDVFARVVHEASEREGSRQGVPLITVG